MKKYRKLIIAVIIALIFIGTFVFLWHQSHEHQTSRRYERRVKLRI